MSAVSRHLTLLLLLGIFLSPNAFADDHKTPEKVMAKMEAALLKIKNRKLKFRTEATGAIAATFEGEVIFKKDNVIDYRTSGKFAGKEHKLFLECDGTKLRGGSEVKPFELKAPSDLRSGLLIGMSRMGLMHNIARLTGSQPPERTDGTVFKWLAINDASFAKNQPVDAPMATAELKQKDKKLMVVFFKLGVDGKKDQGDVELWIDTKTNLPTYRAITVHFPQGDMFVTEKYEWSKM